MYYHRLFFTYETLFKILLMAIMSYYLKLHAPGAKTFFQARHLIVIICLHHNIMIISQERESFESHLLGDQVPLRGKDAHHCACLRPLHQHHRHPQSSPWWHCRAHRSRAGNHHHHEHEDKTIDDHMISGQGLSPEFASMLLVVLIGGYTLVGGLGVI